MAPDLVARWHAVVQSLFSNPSVCENLNGQTVSLAPLAPAALAQSLRAERKVMGELVKASGYVPE